MKDSQFEKIKLMEARIKELEQAVGQKQMNIEGSVNYNGAGAPLPQRAPFPLNETMKMACY